MLDEKVINAISQLNANQAALIQQMAAMSVHNNHTVPPAQITVPPIQQHTIKTQAPYVGAATQRGTFNVEQGRRGGQGRQYGQGNNGIVPTAPVGAETVGIPNTQAGAY